MAVALGGGACGLDNLRTLCTPCHRAETAKLLRKLREEANAKATQGTRDIRAHFSSAPPFGAAAGGQGWARGACAVGGAPPAAHPRGAAPKAAASQQAARGPGAAPGGPSAVMTTADAGPCAPRPSPPDTAWAFGARNAPAEFPGTLFSDD